MKKFILLTFLIFSTSVYSQKIGFTTDGDKIILYSNGTWEYANKEKNSQSLNNNKTVRFSNKKNKNYIRGSRGGCYYINSNGNKTYVDRSMCNDNTTTNTYSSKLNSSKKSSSKRKYTTRRYIRGSRGGCYYINSNGNKTYVDRSMCN